MKRLLALLVVALTLLLSIAITGCPKKAAEPGGGTKPGATVPWR